MVGGRNQDGSGFRGHWHSRGRIGGLMIGPSSAIQLEQLLILAAERLVTRLSRQGTCFLRRADSFNELAGFSVSRGERADHKSPPDPGQLAGLLAEPDGFGAVAKIGVRTGA